MFFQTVHSTLELRDCPLKIYIAIYSGWNNTFMYMEVQLKWS